MAFVNFVIIFLISAKILTQHILYTIEKESDEGYVSISTVVYHIIFLCCSFYDTFSMYVCMYVLV